MNQPHVISVHVCSANFKNYSYVLFSPISKHAIIIDPAWEIEKYTEVFNRHGLIPNHILLTHTHYDHMNLVKFFTDQYHVNVWVHEKERKRLSFLGTSIHCFSHLEVLKLNDLECTVFSTPGHSPGSSCFYIGSNLFSGDTLFIEGCGICTEPEANPGDLYESIMFLKNTISSEIKIYPGHRFQSYPGEKMDFVLKNNIYLHLENKVDFVTYRMRDNQLNLFNFK